MRIRKHNAIAVLLVMGAAIAAPQKRSREEPELPAGKGLAVIQEACVQCHDFRVIAAQRKTPGAWRRTVNEMIWKGAPLMENEAELVVQYLAASFAATK